MRCGSAACGEITYDAAVVSTEDLNLLQRHGSEVANAALDARFAGGFDHKEFPREIGRTRKERSRS